MDKQREIMFAACAMWEAMLEVKDRRPGSGAVEDRYWCCDNAARCDAVYDAVVAAVPAYSDFEAFDWEFVPEFLDRCVEHGKIKDDAEAIMIEYARQITAPRRKRG